MYVYVYVADTHFGQDTAIDACISKYYVCLNLNTWRFHNYIKVKSFVCTNLLVQIYSCTCMYEQDREGEGERGRERVENEEGRGREVLLPAFIGKINFGTYTRAWKDSCFLLLYIHSMVLN